MGNALAFIKTEIAEPEMITELTYALAQGL